MQYRGPTSWLVQIAVSVKPSKLKSFALHPTYNSFPVTLGKAALHSVKCVREETRKQIPRSTVSRHSLNHHSVSHQKFEMTPFALVHPKHFKWSRGEASKNEIFVAVNDLAWPVTPGGPPVSRNPSPTYTVCPQRLFQAFL